MYVCETCGKEHSGAFGSGRFCCRRCATMIIFSKESRNKLSNSLKGKHPKRTKKKCDKCGLEISSSNFKRHHDKCTGLGLIRYTKIKNCYYCNKNIENENLQKHLSYCPLNPNKNKKPKCAGWNKGKNKNNDDRIKKQSENLKKTYKTGNVKIVRNPFWKGKKMPRDIVEKSKKSRLKYLKNNREKTPWNKNKLTYGENYLYQLFLQNNLHEKYVIVNEYCEFPYFLDFAFINEKVDVEFDGGCHFKNGNERYEHDIKRDEFLKEKGWRIYRIPYYELKNFKLENLLEFIGNSVLNENIDKVNYILKYKEYKEKQLNKIKEEKNRIKKIKIENKNKEIEIKKILILESDIKFEKNGWVKYAAILLGCNYRKVNKWMRKNMLEFYNERCFKRKKNN